MKMMGIRDLQVADRVRIGEAKIMERSKMGTMPKQWGVKNLIYIISEFLNIWANRRAAVCH